MRYLSVVLLLSALCCRIVVAQQLDSAAKPTTLGIVAASLAPAAVLGIAIGQNYYDFWRNSNKVPFYFSNDPPYAMHADKLGHAMYSYICADVVKLCYSEAGVDRKTSAWLGFASSFLAQTMVEIGDGFHGNEPYYGFSPGDEFGDIIGASFSLAKEYVPYLKRFDYKIGVWPSQAYHEGAFRGLLDDDESQFFWLSMDVHDYIGGAYPAWLRPAIGYGVENLTSSAFLPSRQGLTPKSLVYLGLDLDLRQLPIEGDTWRIIAEILSHYRIPLPALQVTPIVKWHWLKP